MIPRFTSSSLSNRRKFHQFALRIRIFWKTEIHCANCSEAVIFIFIMKSNSFKSSGLPVDASPATFAVMVRDARSMVIFWDCPEGLASGSDLALQIRGGEAGRYSEEMTLDLPSGRLLLALSEVGQSYEVVFGTRKDGNFDALSTQLISLPPAKTTERSPHRDSIGNRRTSVFLPQETLVLVH